MPLMIPPPPPETERVIKGYYESEVSEQTAKKRMHHAMQKARLARDMADAAVKLLLRKAEAR